MKRTWSKINKKTFLPPAALLLAILIVGVVMPVRFGKMMTAVLNWMTTNFGWFFALGTTFLVGVIIWVCFSKYGSIKFGGDDAKPDMSRFQWFCVVMTSGMASGICYYAVAEPLSFFENPPKFSGLTGGTEKAAEEALKYVFLHWTLHPYALYTLVGVACGFMYWNYKKPFSVASGLYPLLGERSLGATRHWVNALAVFALVSGVGTSLGLTVDQITVSINYVTGWELDAKTMGIFICLGLAFISILAASSGLHKAISHISSANMYMFFFLMIFALVFGGTRFILNNTVSSVGKFLSFFAGQSLYTEPAYQSGWVNSWTIFYWAWWLVYAPLVGLFQVKMAKGRTIREFIIVNMFVPTAFLILWFGTFGSSVIYMGLNGVKTVSAAFHNLGSSVAFFAYLKELPLAPVLIIVALLSVVFSVLTLTEAEVLTIADLCVKDEETTEIQSPLFLKAFWGLVMCMLGFVLLYSGGLNALQTASVVLGFPILILLLFMAVSLIKGLKNYKK